jgi:ABC-type glycerol-3-phosphate transport system permease component
MKNILRRLSTHIILILICILSLIPFLWLLSTALKGRSENIFAYPPVFIPKDLTLANFKEVLKLDKKTTFVNLPSLVETSDAAPHKFDSKFNILYCGNLGTIQLINLILILIKIKIILLILLLKIQEN